MDDKQISKYERIIFKFPAISFILIFICSISVLIGLFFIIRAPFAESTRFVAKANLGYLRKQAVVKNANLDIKIYNDGEDKFLFTEIFYNHPNQDGSLPVRNVDISIFRETFIPLALFVSLILSFPDSIKKKIIPLIAGFFLLYLFSIFKISIMGLDNYEFPEWAPYKFAYLLDGFVYYSSKFFFFTGFSSSFYAPTFLFFIFSYFFFDYNKLLHLKEDQFE